MVKEIADFEDMFNQIGYTGNGTGSVRDYFRESSYGKFDLTITLCGIYEAPKEYAYYKDRAGELATWLANQVKNEPNIDFRDFDTDNDGMVDGFHFIFAGIGQETGQCPNCIWSHKSEIPIPVSSNGKYIKVYSCSPELRNGSNSPITTIGVICHEMTHALGKVPDYYDTDYEVGGKYDGTGNWDIMANGSYNGNPSGNRPAHHNMYTKVFLGWVVPVELNASTSIKDMPNSAENPVAYKIKTTTTNEYYLLENRQKVKFDASIPGSGLIIYHVHANQTTSSSGVNATHPQRMYPVSSGCTFQVPVANKPDSYQPINSPRCPFPGTGPSPKSSFTDETTPAMKSWAGKNTGKPITNITHANGLISFDFTNEVGINEPDEMNNTSLKIIPNPANDYIDVQFSTSHLISGNVDIYSFTGQLVKSVPCNAEFKEDVMTQRISITDLSKGVYFIKTGNESAKLVVQ
jgi:M6 family metalloprotease-like protein